MTGNFSKFNNGNYDLTATLEFSEKLDTNSIKKEVKKLNWIDQVLKSHYKDESYIIHGPNTRQKVKELKNNLQS